MAIRFFQLGLEGLSWWTWLLLGYSFCNVICVPVAAFNLQTWLVHDVLFMPQWLRMAGQAELELATQPGPKVSLRLRGKVYAWDHLTRR